MLHTWNTAHVAGLLPLGSRMECALSRAALAQVLMLWAPGPLVATLCHALLA